MVPKDCCLAIVKDLQNAGQACLDLHLEEPGDVRVSILGKPGNETGSVDFIRIKDIGTLICRGPVARKIKDLAGEPNGEAVNFGSVLTLIGVPLHHEGIYDQALKSGLVIIILQGTDDALRRGCGILENVSLVKPVLYLS